MKNHFTISHPQEVIPEVAMIPEEEEKLQKECLKEGRSRAIGGQRACFVAHHRLLGHQEENVEIEHVRQFWEAEQRLHEKHFWKTKLGMILYTY